MSYSYHMETLPVTVDSGEEKQIRVSIRVPAMSPGPITRAIEFWTDSPSQPRVSVEFQFSVLPTSATVADRR